MATVSNRIPTGRSSERPQAAAGAERPDIIGARAARTLPGLFRARVARTPDKPAYRHYDEARATWVDTTWREMGHHVERWINALAAEGYEAGERVAVMLRNSREWVMFDQAALALGLVVVPLYVNDRADNCAYILRDTGARLLLVAGIEQWRPIAEHETALPALRRVVTLSHAPAQGSDRFVVDIATWLDRGIDDYTLPATAPDDLATIVYTSGTLGRPKGVMLSHYNILWNVEASLKPVAVRSDELFLSFLPLSHTFERTVGYYLPMMAGCTVAYARSIRELAEDLRAVRPTLLISVPRIFERVHNRLLDRLEGRSLLARALFHKAVEVGWQEFLHRQGRARRRVQSLLWPILERLVARKITERMGGRVRLAICGGAPLSPDVARVFIALGLPILQGYGLTETSPVISVNWEDDNDPASVGHPLPGCEVITGEHDELLVRSPAVMLGYWCNQGATSQTIDREGWLHTGDRARIENGRIYIIGRLKEIIVLSTGEKVPPADMEIAIAIDPLIDQILIIGEGRSYLTAIAVLNPDRW
nr:long-chain fatty acid--CoA ligase [Gammaproteobacteria bacterium]